MSNAFCHVELNTDDLTAAKRFYGGLFDWNLSDVPMGPGIYTMIDVGGGTGGGMQTKPMPGAPTQWLPYVEVADVRKTVEKARGLGATIVVPYMPLPEMGAIAIMIDPTGAGIGVWERGASARGGSRKATGKGAAKKAARKPAKAGKKPAKAGKKPAKAAKKPVKPAKKPVKAAKMPKLGGGKKRGRK